MGKLYARLRAKTAFKTDARLRLIGEVLSGIEVIKMYVWEKLFINYVNKVRR